MEEKEQKILIAAWELFKKYGIRNLNMDEISRQLGISKKTLYRYVKNKEDLLKRSFFLALELEKEGQCHMHETYDNPIDEMLAVNESICKSNKDLNPIAVFELKRYYPSLYDEIFSSKLDYVKGYILQNLEKGVANGLYRDNMNIEIIARMYVGRMQTIVNEEIFPGNDYSFNEIVNESIRFHIYGIVSQKGREYLEEKINHRSK
jgi:AcrR family transcriptional regulator